MTRFTVEKVNELNMTSEIKTSVNTLFDTGSVIDNKWVLMELIGKGGMGEVFRAHQLNLKRDVAIKVISEEFLQDFEEDPEEVANAIKRLQREVQTMAQVRHPNVLQIFDFGSIKTRKKGFTGPFHYIAMEFVSGDTFRITMSEEGFSDETELLADWLQRYFLPVLDGLEAIHGLHIIHRDVKPENILMDGDIPKIADFGLARSPKLKAVSNSWDVKGTTPYMAPEQFAEFRRADIPADIYSLGKILYEAINGKLNPKMIPFKSVALEDPNTNLLKSMDMIIRKATDENQHKRYQTISELRMAIFQALKSLNEEEPHQRDAAVPIYVRWLWVGIVLVLIAVGGMSIYHLVDSGISEKTISNNKELLSEKKNSIIPIKEKLSSTRISEDGREMKLVKSPENDPMFYSDPSLVSFHHYVEFLNEVNESLRVIDGVVRKDDEIWIYLGDGSSQSDQIIYQHSRFHLRKAEWASKPVIRVTWLGAKAYAQHFGKRLSTYNEWQLLRQQFSIAMDLTQGSAENPMHSHMEINKPTQNENPIQNNQIVVKEWLAWKKPDSTLNSQVVEWFNSDDLQSSISKRYPWEGFYDVGFRTVMDLPGTN